MIKPFFTPPANRLRRQGAKFSFALATALIAAPLFAQQPPAQPTQPSATPAAQPTQNQPAQKSPTPAAQPAQNQPAQQSPAPASQPTQNQPAQKSPAPAQAAPSAKAPDAQQDTGGSGADIGVTTLKTTVNEVDLIFTVTDKHGHYIPNLKQSDFALLDDGKAPLRVNSFHQQINLPLRVGIVIDTSTSIHSRFKFEQQAAIDFLLQIVKARSDRAFVMGFDVTPTVTANWISLVVPMSARRTSVGGWTAGSARCLLSRRR